MTFDEWWKDNGRGLGHLTEDARRIWEAAQAEVGHVFIWKFASEKANERAAIAEKQLATERERVRRYREAIAKWKEGWSSIRPTPSMILADFHAIDAELGKDGSND